MNVVIQPRYKYPRTNHLPFSQGLTDGDKRMMSDDCLCDKLVVITEKMDGENTTIYCDGFHARSIDSAHRDYHSWLIQYIQNFMYKIPDNYRICGEYLYAKHSIEYNYLPSYFEVFSVWMNDICCSWEHTKAMCDMLNLYHVPVLYEGLYRRALVKEIAEDVVRRGGEGIVVRNSGNFQLKDWESNIAKYVRANHVQTDEHWSQGHIEHNKLRDCTSCKHGGFNDHWNDYFCNNRESCHDFSLWEKGPDIK